MAEFINGKLPQEIEEGNIEYKKRLDELDDSTEKFTKMVSQAIWRMDEGYKNNGVREAIYYIGINDDGAVGNVSISVLEKSIKNFRKVVITANAEIKNVEFFCFTRGNVAKLTIHALPVKNSCTEITVGLLGPSGQGKTTLVGVMSYGMLDNGLGTARNCVLRHNHEYDTGETTSIKHEIVGYSESKIHNYNSGFIGSWEDIVSESDTVVNLLDMPGHVKYIKTTLFCLNSYLLEYVGITVSCTAFDDNIRMLYLHTMMCHLLDIPHFFIITKMDQVDDSGIDVIVDKLNYLIQKVIGIDKSVDNISTTGATILSSNKIAAIPVSCVTNQNIDILHSYIKLLPPTTIYDSTGVPDAVEFMVNDVMFIPEVGTAVIGIMLDGHINIDDKLLIGPFDNAFIDITVKSVHKKQISHSNISIGEYGSMVIKVNNKKMLDRIDKHMMIVSPNKLYNFVNTFDIVLKPDFIFLKDESVNFEVGNNYKINKNAKVMVFIKNVYERIKIIDIIKRDDSMILRVKFINDIVRYIRDGSKIVIRYPPRFIFGRVFKLVDEHIYI